MFTVSGLQCPICQKSGFTQQNIVLHTSYCLDQVTKKNQTKPTIKPSKKTTNINRGQGNGLKGNQKGKISWDRTVIDVDLTSDNEDDNDDDFVDGHHPIKKKTIVEQVSSSSSSSSSFIGTGKENRIHQEQSSSLGTTVDNHHQQQQQRQPGRNVNGLDRMGPLHPSNTHPPTTLVVPTTHHKSIVHDVPLTLQQNIEQMALRAMVIFMSTSFFSFHLFFIIHPNFTQPTYPDHNLSYVEGFDTAICF